jgi:DNA-binding CsgD family transcriptional regulator
LSAARRGEPYAEVRPTMRRALHRTAATRSRGEAAWLHRVAAATGADESLAAALESAAALSAPAGPGQPGPARLFEWAADLSADQDARERRLLTAVLQRVCAGHIGSPDLWARAESCPPSPLRSCAMAGRALLEGRQLEAGFHLNHAVAHAVGQPDQVLAFTHGLRAAICSLSGLGEQTMTEAAAGLARTGGDRGLERWLTRLLAAGRCFAEGPRAALGTLAGLEDEPPEAVTALAIGCYLVLAGEPGEAIGALPDLAIADRLAWPAETRAEAALWLALAFHLLGAWRDAVSQARTATRIAQESGAPTEAAACAVRALLAAHGANWGKASQYLARARALDRAPRGEVSVLTDLAEVTISHAQGAALTGHRALLRLTADKGAARKFRALWIPYEAEALVLAGSVGEAALALSELEALSEQVPWLRVAHGRLAGLLAERDRQPLAARRHYEAALGLPEECLVVPFQVGILEQCYGRLLRGLGDADEGAAWIDRARDRLLAAGSVAYARRCHAEAFPWPPGSSAGALTGRESEVGRLVVAGLTNKQVADRLFISTRTVEYHLAQIYGKLGVRSRRQLTRLAGEQPG